MSALPEEVLGSPPRTGDMAARFPQADQVLVAETVNDSDTGRRSSTSSTAGHNGHGGLSHICHICSNRYERADYLKRHLASHENARQHVCSRCRRRFNRKDLLTRHLANHDAEETTGPASQRTLQACDGCIRSKTKCNNRRPCQRCVRRSMSCIVSSSSRSTRMQNEQFDIGPVPSAPSLNQAAVGPGSLNPAMSNLLPESSQASTLPPATASSDQVATSIFQHDNVTLDPSDDSFRAGMGWGAFISPSGLFHFGKDIDFHLGSELDFQSNNFTYHSSDTSNPAPNSTLAAGYRASIAGERSQANEGSTVGNHHYVAKANVTGYEAFKKSPWLWTPVRHDHAYAEGSQLSVDEVQLMESPEVQDLHGADHTLPKMKDSATRDEMLSLVLKFSSSSVRIRSFPSFRLLNILIQAFFVKENSSVTPWLHAATFDPDSVRGELLAGIVADGATLFAVPNIWKMGLALQEIVKLATAAAIDEDNRRVRDLQSIQAFWLWIKIGRWSGFRRKMEIAEGFAHTVPTMLRGSGAFRQSKYIPAVVPTENDSGETLKQKWLEWVEQESFKRLVLQVMMNDMKSSIAFTRSSLFSSTEITFSLPAAQECWEAKNEREWRRNLLSKSQMTTNVTLMDAMHDPSILEKQADIIDIGFCSHAILLGLWGRVCSFLESKAFHSRDNSDTHASSSLWLEAQRQDLYQRIQTVSTKLGWILPLSSEARLVSEFLMMSLHVSAEEVQRIAGRYGEDELRSSLPRLTKWNESRDGRFAKWHAGQVLRAARSFLPTQLDSFNGLTTYHACLVLWVSCAMNQESINRTKPNSVTQPAASADSLIRGDATDQGTNSGPASAPLSANPTKKQQPKVRIDGEETPEVRAYLSMGVGQPCLQVSGQVVGLENPQVISTALSEIFRSNFPSESHPLPPMLENLENLMGELSRTHHF